MVNKKLAFIIFICAISCESNRNIIKLLNSKDKDELIEGAYLAGESGNKKYSSLLLKNADDVRTSTNLKFKGYTVYQEKMIALSKIYNKKPPIEINERVDSSIIIFYIQLSQSSQK